ncbi:TolC family protein [Poriferisphaera sp. WC338]|uniref:TolC family protein n=1 Tax=Poriferisphaera sp. WC338 TaxID=3425129 RepID=UPI003D8187EE
MRQRCYLISLLSTILISGCTTSPITDSWSDPRPLGRDLTTFKPPTINQSRNKFVEQREQFAPPRSKLKLKDAMSAALLNNPQLAIYAYEIRASEARTLQTSLWPNPEISIEAENIGGSGSYENIDSLEVTAAFSQTFLTAGKLKKAVRHANLQSQVAAWEYEIQRIALLTNVRQQFVDVLLAQSRFELLKESQELSQQVFDLVNRRAEAGDIPAVEAIRAQVPLARASVELERATYQLASERIQLAGYWGEPNAVFDVADGTLEELYPLPEISELVALINQNPRIAKQTVEIAQQDAAIRLEKANATPDITATAGLRYFNDENDSAFVLGLSLPLAIFDRNQGNIWEARFNRAKSLEAQSAAEVLVSVELGRAYQQLSQTHHVVLSLKNKVIPPAQEAYNATKVGFEQGNLRYLDVLDARQALVESQIEYLEVLGSYHRTVAQIEGLIGQSLRSITNE